MLFAEASALELGDGTWNAVGLRFLRFNRFASSAGKGGIRIPEGVRQNARKHATQDNPTPIPTGATAL